MTDDQDISVNGLEDVIAAETRLSEVDGEAGKLTIAGHRVEQLAGEYGFEQVCHLLWNEELPDEQNHRQFIERLGRRRTEIFDRLERVGLPSMNDPMDALRAGIGMFETTGDSRDDATTAAAAMPVVAAMWWNDKNDRSTPRPQQDATTAEDYLRMVTGESPKDVETSGLGRYLVAVSDHGLNASTFTARIITSTRSDLISAIVGAISALKGPLHGGAPGPVLDMLDDIGEPERAEEWIRNELAEGRRIMGMGHRVYRVRDPRATVFEGAVDELMVRTKSSDRLELARAVEDVATDVLAEKYPDRKLDANVEFYTAVLLEAVGLPRALFTPTFAVGRAAGWSAHVIEQAEADKLIRPSSRYVGPVAN